MLWWIHRWTKEHGKFCDTGCLLIRVVVVCWSEWWFFVSLSGALLGRSCFGRNSAKVEVINDSTVLVSYIFIQLLERHVSVKQWSPALCLCLSLSLCLPVCISFCLSSTSMKMCVYTMWWTNCRKFVTLEVGFFKLLSVVHLSLKVGMMVTSMQLCSFTSLSMTMTGNKCWRCYCVWHGACWRVYCSFTSLSMTMTGNKCWRCYCVWHGACWRVYCSFTSLSMTMTLCVTLGMLKSVLFIDITFNDHDTVWQRACWKVYCSLTSLPVTMTLCDMGHVEECIVHSHHFQ